MQVIELPDPSIRPTALGFSPDGQRLAAWTETALLVVDPAAGTARPLWRTTPARPGNRNPGVGFTADGRGVVALRLTDQPGDSTAAVIGVFDVETGAVLRECPARSWTVIEIGPGGRWVFVVAHEKGRFGIVRWDPLTGESLPPFGESGNDMFQIAVLADERCVVAAVYNAVRVLTFTGKGPPKRASKQFPVDMAYVKRALAVSADGAFVAATELYASGCRVEAWVVGSGERVGVAETASGYPAGRSVRFHPTRPLLAYCAGTDEVVFWDAASRTEVRRFAWGVGRVSAVEFSADGLRCAAATEGKVVVWDVDA